MVSLSRMVSRFLPAKTHIIFFITSKPNTKFAKSEGNNYTEPNPSASPYKSISRQPHSFQVFVWIFGK